MPKLSRRRLLAASVPAIGGAAAALHSAVPHTHPWDSEAKAAAGPRAREQRRRRPRRPWRRPRELPRRPHGRPRGQRLRPARDPARLRLGHDRRLAVRPRGARVGARRARQGDRGRARRPLRRLDLQRPHPRPDAALPRGRAAADHVRQRLRRTRTRSTSTASTPPRWTACRGSARARSRPGGRTVYEFDAQPAGLHLYHCHVRPLAEHIAKGLYGAFIVDPRTAARTPTSW